MFWAAYQYLLVVILGEQRPGFGSRGWNWPASTEARGTSASALARLASFFRPFPWAWVTLWVFLDEDSLCWHDRITHTYLAPQDTTGQVPAWRPHTLFSFRCQPSCIRQRSCLCYLQRFTLTAVGNLLKHGYICEGSKPAIKVFVATTVMLTFISFWRASAIVLSDLASSAYYAGGDAEKVIGKSAPWFILAVMLFSYAVRALYIESSSMFVRGGVYRVVKEAMGGGWPSFRSRRCCSITC